MTLKKLISTVLIISCLCSFSFSTFANAESIEKSDGKISETVKEKIDAFVTIDSKTNTFSLDKKKAKKVLSKKELQIAENLIGQSNELLKKASLDSTIAEITITQNKSFKLVTKDTTAPYKEGTVTAKSIRYYMLSDYELNWWGLRIYLSHDAILNLKANLSLILAASTGASGAAGGAAGIICTACGFSSFAGPVGVTVTGVCAVVIAIEIYRVLSSDHGNGVLIDFNYFNVSLPMLPNIYLGSISPVYI